jgi:hypothetical protein
MPRPLTLKAKDAKPVDLGPNVRVEGVQLTPPNPEAKTMPIVDGTGLADKDGFKRHNNNPKSMWLGECTAIEFDLAEPASLAAIEVWNYNAEEQTGNGLRKADIAVSTDGSTWQTVLRDVEFAEADGRAGYDNPVVVKLNGVKASKVRFENLSSWGSDKKIGLSEVVFHSSPGTQTGQ